MVSCRVFLRFGCSYGCDCGAFLIKYAPDWATVGLKKFGKNRYGQYQFRVVWAPSVMRIFGGYWDDVGKSEYRLVPKYGLDPKWALERWRPAVMYGIPELWDSQTVTPDGFYSVGPFPCRGAFEMCEKFSTGKGEAGFVPLEPGLIEMTARAVWMGRINSYSDIRRIHLDQLEAKERQHDQNFDDMWDEKQLTRSGLSIGAAGAFDKNKEVEDYERKITRSKAVMQHAKNFKAGFNQT